jgi:hypothetical protein
MARRVVQQRKELADLCAGKRREITYDPTDADEQAEAAAGGRPRTAIRRAEAIDVFSGADSAIREPMTD